MSSTCPTFEELLEAERPYLIRQALRFSRDRNQADDYVQDAMLRAWQARGRFEQGTSIRAWTSTILRRAALTEVMKAKRRRTETESGSGVPLESFAHEAHGPVKHEAVLESLDSRTRRAIEACPHTYQETFLLAYVDGFKLTEISKLLNVPHGTVMSRIHRARLFIRERVQQPNGKPWDDHTLRSMKWEDKVTEEDLGPKKCTGIEAVIAVLSLNEEAVPVQVIRSRVADRFPHISAQNVYVSLSHLKKRGVVIHDAAKGVWRLAAAKPIELPNEPRKPLTKYQQFSRQGAQYTCPKHGVTTPLVMGLALYCSREDCSEGLTLIPQEVPVSDHKPAEAEPAPVPEAAPKPALTPSHEADEAPMPYEGDTMSHEDLPPGPVKTLKELESYVAPDAPKLYKEPNVLRIKLSPITRKRLDEVLSYCPAGTTAEALAERLLAKALRKFLAGE